jgi:hypothetical protein
VYQVITTKEVIRGKLGASLEEELRLPLDLVPLSPPTRLTRIIERKGKVLYEAG